MTPEMRDRCRAALIRYWLRDGATLSAARAAAYKVYPDHTEKPAQAAPSSDVQR